MLEYLILNNRIEAAIKFNETTSKSFKEDLLAFFSKGKRTEFMRIYLLLRHQEKLQFYLRVYFLIYNIHPALKAKNAIPEEEITVFKQYLDTKGADLAKTNEFLEFYALPFVKKPLEHPSYKNLFKKQWVSNLAQKLNIFIHEEQRRMREVSHKLLNISTNLIKQDDQKKLKNMEANDIVNSNLKILEQKNKKLFEQLQQFKQKYIRLQQGNQAMIQSFNSYMMQSQNKWFQITKELTGNAKILIEIIIKSNSSLINDRKFLRIKKKTEKYQKFVKKQLDELLSQSQDISVFDRPSVNQISYSASITPNISQRNITTFICIDEFIPTNYIALIKDFKKMSDEAKIKIIRGFSWRIIKSKDKWIRRQTIIGLVVNDFLGLMTGDIMELLLNKSVIFYILELISFISEDSYGSKVFFRNGGLYKELVELIPEVIHDKNYDSLAKILQILESLSPNKEMIFELINLNIIDVYVSVLLEDEVVINNEDMLQNVLTLMLNMTTVSEGLYSYQSQINIFFTLSQVFNTGNQLIRTLIGGIIYTLIGQESFWSLAHEAKVPEFINQLLAFPTINTNKKQLKMIQQKLTVFQPASLVQNADADLDESLDSNLEEQIFERNEQQLDNLQQYIQGHDILNSKYFLKNKEAQKQIEEINRIMDQIKRKRQQKQVKPVSKRKTQQIVIKKQVNTGKIVPKLPEIKNKKIQNENSFGEKKSSSKDKIYDQDYYSYKSPSFKNNDARNANSQQASFENDKSAQAQKVKINNFDLYQKPNEQKLVISKQQSKTSLADKKVDKLKKQKNSNNKPEYRIKKSSSVDKNIGNILRNQEMIVYETNKEVKLMKSPPQKRTREEVLRQLNQQLKAEFKMQENKERKLSSKHISSNDVQPIERENTYLKKNNFVGPTEEVNAFASRPKIRRTPPKQDE